MRRIKRLQIIFLAGLLLLAAGCATFPARGPLIPRYNRIVAVGDVHGSYSGLVSILKQTAIIDDANQWIGGNVLLVQTGDILDRGPDVRQVMDLLMALQDQAPAAGGRVVVLLGNHEAMNVVGSMHYVNPAAYNRFAGPDSEEKQNKAFERWNAFFGDSTALEGEDPETQKQKWLAAHPPGFVEYTEAMGPEGKYGKWLRSLPAVFRYGGTIFLHAGISPGYADMTASIINENIVAELEEFDSAKSYLMARGYVEQYFSMSEIISVVDSIVTAAETQELPPSILEALPRVREIKSFLDGFYDVSPLMADEGPLWFKGFTQLPNQELVSYVPGWLQKNNVWRVIVSHVPQADGTIQSRLDASIFLIDTGMLSEYYDGGRASALEIKDDDVCAVYETGERYSFPAPKIDYGPEHVWKGPDGTALPFETVYDIEQFLLTASPVSIEVIDTGVNRPQKVLLEKDGKEFNSIFRYESEIDDGKLIVWKEIERRFFRDSYQSEIAAYEMNRILGLNNMPPTVYRTIDGKQGTLQLWAEQTMLDRQRAKDNILPPEAAPWNRQMWDMRVFDNLINNIDRNQTNILIDDNWRLIPIDHTRSFARDRTLPHPERVVHCSRGLWYALRHLDESDVRTRLSPYLSTSEIDALFVRRRLLVELINDLIARDGEENVLF